NARERGESVSVAGVSPVPVSGTDCVPTLSMTVSAPVRVPDAVGRKAMERLQLVCAGRELPQVSAVIRKSPVTVLLCNAALWPPLLLTVTICADEAEPTVVAGNVRVDGRSATVAGASPFPVSV